MAYRQDGTLCRAPARILDPHRGGLVCIAHAFDTYHCPTHGVRSQRSGEVCQVARDEVGMYVCTLCGQVADPTPFDVSAETSQEGKPPQGTRATAHRLTLFSHLTTLAVIPILSRNG
jgi:hypothetical protein